MNEFELLAWAARIITPIDGLWCTTSSNRPWSRLAAVLTLLLDLFLDCLDFFLFLFDHVLDLVDLVRERGPVNASLRLPRWSAELSRLALLLVDRRWRCWLEFLGILSRRCTRAIYIRLGCTWSLIGCSAASLWRSSLSLHVHWQLEGVELRFLQVLVESRQFACLHHTHGNSQCYFYYHILSCAK